MGSKKAHRRDSMQAMLKGNLPSRPAHLALFFSLTALWTRSLCFDARRHLPAATGTSTGAAARAAAGKHGAQEQHRADDGVRGRPSGSGGTHASVTHGHHRSVRPGGARGRPRQRRRPVRGTIPAAARRLAASERLQGDGASLVPPRRRRRGRGVWGWGYLHRRRGRQQHGAHQRLARGGGQSRRGGRGRHGQGAAGPRSPGPGRRPGEQACRGGRGIWLRAQDGPSRAALRCVSCVLPSYSRGLLFDGIAALCPS